MKRAWALVVAAALIPACGGGGGGGGGAPAGSGAVPAGLPTHFSVGLTSNPTDLAWMTGSGVPWGYRYQYLSGGVNTGSGWSTWNSPAGDFARLYMVASQGAGYVPVLDYYQIVQSTPNAGSENPDPKLQNGATMNAYFADFKLLMQKAGQFGGTVIVHIEPDFWGFCESVHGSDPSVISVQVASSGFAEAAGYANNLCGFAQVLFHLRDLYGPNAFLALHASHWATGADLIANHVDPVVQANAIAGFLGALGVPFDLLFHDPTDRDAGFKQYVDGDGGASWWNASDFARYRAYLAQVWSATGRRAILWELPCGNTLYRTCNNSTGHYQDNRAEFFLQAGNGTNVADFANAGVIAILFGGTDAGTTHHTDSQSDGVTNPAAINGNTAAATVPDDDGGFLRSAAAAYYAAGAVALP